MESAHAIERRTQSQRANKAAAGPLIHKWLPSTRALGTASTRGQQIGTVIPFCVDMVLPSSEALLSAPGGSSPDVRWS